MNITSDDREDLTSIMKNLYAANYQEYFKGILYTYIVIFWCRDQFYVH